MIGLKESTYTCKAKEKQWNKMTLKFYSGDNTGVWLSLYNYSQVVGANDVRIDECPIYVDGISCKQITELPDSDAQNFEWGTETREKYEFNFEDFYFLSQRANRFYVDDAPKKDGNKNNKAIHFMKGLHVNNATFYGADTSIVSNYVVTPENLFNLRVKPNTKYTLSYWLYLEKEETKIPYFAVYVDFPNTDVLLKPQSDIKSGEWIMVDQSFFTGENQNMLSLMIILVKSIIIIRKPLMQHQ